MLGESWTTPSNLMNHPRDRQPTKLHQTPFSETVTLRTPSNATVDMMSSLDISGDDEDYSAFPSMSMQSQLTYQSGLITIGVCTLAFASLSPISKLLLSSEEGMSALLLNAMTSTLAFLFVWIGGPLLETTFFSSSNTLNDRDESSNDENAWKGGLELGLWKSLATTANLYGLSMTTADHGAFLIQLTTLIVPTVQALCGVPIPCRIQGSVALALMGVFLFTQDSTANVAGTTSIAQSTQQLGDLLCIVAAGFYATYDLRLFQWGQCVAPRPLMVRKIFFQAVLAITFLCISQEPVGELWQNASRWCTPTILALVVWSGFIVNALVPFLQVTGQQIIGPTRSQTIYASQPLWASLMSFALLGEIVGFQGFVGGSAFLVALMLAATTEPPESKNAA
jgi:drug/metabolite transporter (DMT)-like permease